MSYAGNVARESRRPASGAGPQPLSGKPTRRDIHRLYRDSEIDWQQVAIFATGLTLGLLAGAGSAILFAPNSGRQTRRSIARAGRKLRHRTHDAWDDLREELRRAGRRSRRSIERTLEDRRRDRQLARRRRAAAAVLDED
jgi:hypothetical protein